jgi:hypothetical protein
MNGLLDMQGAQAPMQQPMQGGLLGSMQQPSSAQMPPEMMKVVEQIKSLPPDQKNMAAQNIIEKIQQMPKSPQEKQQAIQQFMAAVQ